MSWKRKSAAYLFWATMCRHIKSYGWPCGGCVDAQHLKKCPCYAAQCLLALPFSSCSEWLFVLLEVNFHRVLSPRTFVMFDSAWTACFSLLVVPSWILGATRWRKIFLWCKELERHKSLWPNWSTLIQGISSWRIMKSAWRASLRYKCNVCMACMS